MSKIWAKKMTPSPKRDEAILFSTTVSINNEGNLITRHESLPTNEVLNKLSDDYYAHLICAIVNDCKSDSYYFDEQLSGLLKTI